MTHDRGLRETLHTSGRRLTRQRRLVLKVLEESREHLDAEELHDRAKALDPNISLATVYRTLVVLKEMGLVEEHRLGEGHAHFEAPRESPHYHFTCSRCGRVIEFDAPEMKQVVRRLTRKEGVQVTSAHLILGGRCAQCQGRAEIGPEKGQ
jgi:Fur family ferric uptake transcriptional regulator